MGEKAGTLEEAKEREKGECFSQAGLCVMDCWVLLNHDGGAGGGKGQETLYPPTPPSSQVFINTSTHTVTLCRLS